jgi:hypothetical protein
MGTPVLVYVAHLHHRDVIADPVIPSRPCKIQNVKHVGFRRSPTSSRRSMPFAISRSPFSTVVFDVFSIGIAEGDDEPLTAQRDGVAAAVVRDGNWLDVRSSGGVAPEVAGARGRLVA